VDEGVSDPVVECGVLEGVRRHNLLLEAFKEEDFEELASAFMQVGC
jgi:hypothetical protein